LYFKQKNSYQAYIGMKISGNAIYILSDSYPKNSLKKDSESLG